MDTWSLQTFVMVFCGSVIGTALGTLWAVIVCALLVIVGIGVVMAGGSDFILNQIALGPFFGPHLGSFLVPIIASAYSAGVRKNHPTGNGKDIVSPLIGTSWDVLAVGGLIGCFNWVLFNLIIQIPILNQFDGFGLSIMICCLLGRAVFTREGPFGSKESIQKYGLLGTDNGNIAWQANQSTDFIKSMFLGGCLGALFGGIALAIVDAMQPMVDSGAVAAGNVTLCAQLIGWAIAIFSLLPAFFSTKSFANVPSWHSQCSVPALVAMYTGSIVAAAVTGVLMWLLQELMARLFVNHASNSFCDPPASAIAFGTFFVNILLKPEFLNLSSLFH